MRILITRSLCRKPIRCEGACGAVVQVNECLSSVGPLRGHKGCEGTMLDLAEGALMRGNRAMLQTRYGGSVPPV
jgi:hypothetical protein